MDRHELLRAHLSHDLRTRGKGRVEENHDIMNGAISDTGIEKQKLIF